MIILALLGMPGSGKDLVVQVAREAGFHVVRMGDVVREHALAHYDSLTDENVGSYADRERKERGAGIWAVRTLEVLGKDFIDLVIDGVRNREELEIFRESIGKDLVSLGIKARPGVRFERIRVRSREDSAATWDDFQKREEREYSWGLGQALEEADHYLDNSGTKEEFQDLARAFLHDLRKKT